VGAATNIEDMEIQTLIIVGVAVVGSVAVIASSGVAVLAGIGARWRRLGEDWAPDDIDSDLDD
jgi:hypothetical protein